MKHQIFIDSNVSDNDNHTIIPIIWIIRHKYTLTLCHIIDVALTSLRVFAVDGCDWEFVVCFLCGMIFLIFLFYLFFFFTFCICFVDLTASNVTAINFISCVDCEAVYSFNISVRCFVSFFFCHVFLLVLFCWIFVHLTCLYWVIVYCQFGKYILSYCCIVYVLCYGKY